MVGQVRRDGPKSVCRVACHPIHRPKRAVQPFESGTIAFIAPGVEAPRELQFSKLQLIYHTLKTPHQSSV